MLNGLVKRVYSNLIGRSAGKEKFLVGDAFVSITILIENVTG